MSTLQFCSLRARVYIPADMLVYLQQRYCSNANMFSLHSNSELDIQVKSALVRDALNLVGYVLPEKEDVIPGPSPPTDMR